MNIFSNVNIVKLDDDHIDLIEDFCKACSNYGYSNNSSIEKMKFGRKYDFIAAPEFWGTIYNNKLVSVSGCHLWPANKDNISSMRCLFRSASLPEYKSLISGLSKNHMNSIPFSMLLPLQINSGFKQGVEHFYITTSNKDHDASGKMKRTHRAMQLLAKNFIVKYAGDEIIYSTSQTKWEINIDRYLEVLQLFYKANKESNLMFNEEYLSIINYGFFKKWIGFTTP
jgi:hypothetical protein